MPSSINHTLSLQFDLRPNIWRGTNTCVAIVARSSSGALVFRYRAAPLLERQCGTEKAVQSVQFNRCDLNLFHLAIIVVSNLQI